MRVYNRYIMRQEGELGIIGSGGQAREVAQYLSDEDSLPAFFAVHPEYLSENDVRVNLLNPNEYERITPVVAAIGAPEVRRRLVHEWAGESFGTVIAKDAYVGETVEMGVGCIISPRAVLTANVLLGDHVIVNIGATISHDSKIGNYATISPGAHIAGNVEIGDGVFVGIGATISNGIKIAEGSVIGAGAVVVNDIIENNSVVVGVPAKTIRINEGWLSEV